MIDPNANVADDVDNDEVIGKTQKYAGYFVVCIFVVDFEFVFF